MTRTGNFRKLLVLATAGALSGGIAFAAESPSSPAEQSVTATLNQDISATNTAADQKYNALNAQFQEERTQNAALIAQYKANADMLTHQYDDLRMNYTSLAAQYDQLQKQNNALKQKNADLSAQYQQILARK